MDILRVFITKKAQLKVGLYDPEFKLHADYDLIFKLSKDIELIGSSMDKDHVTGYLAWLEDPAKKVDFNIYMRNSEYEKKISKIFFLLFFYF